MRKIVLFMLYMVCFFLLSGCATSNLDTPLSMAVMESDIDEVNRLIDTGEDVNEPGIANFTALHDASMTGQLKIVKLLIKKGANVNSVADDDTTPLMLAARGGHRKIYDFLIAKGADISMRDQLGRTALDYIALSAPPPLPNTINPPAPIPGNGGNYMSPFTARGGIAPWAVEVQATTNNGSDIAADIGSAVGQEIGRKALDFVPFGLGGMVGDQLGSQAGRSLTRTTIQPEIPSPEEARATSDISFKTADELAVYMYARHSSHREYARILALTQTVYPELAQIYDLAIAQAARSSSQKARNRTASNQPSNNTKDQKKFELLQKLKEEGLISDIEFQAKRSSILYASARVKAGNSTNQTVLSAPKIGKNTHEELKSLQKMKEDGSISRTEFQDKRSKILDAL